MNTYILILTLTVMIPNHGSASGITSIPVKDLDSCERIGRAWAKDNMNKRGLALKNFIYTCVKK